MRARSPSSCPAVLIGAALALLSLGWAGCTSAQAVRVQPWERGALADYSMRSDRDPVADSLTEHVYFAREAASGGKGVGGSGCGCN